MKGGREQKGKAESMLSWTTRRRRRRRKKIEKVLKGEVRRNEK